MKALTKLLSLFLTLCLVLSIAPVTALASETEAPADFVDEPDSFGEIEEQPVISEVSEGQVSDAAPVAGEEVLVELPVDTDESANAVEEPEALLDSPAPTMPAESTTYLFTKQPESGVVAAGSFYTVTWNTNFLPLRVWLYAYNTGIEEPMANNEPLTKFSEEELLRGEAEISPADNQLVLVAWYDEYDYVLSSPFSVLVQTAPVEVGGLNGQEPQAEESGEVLDTETVSLPDLPDQNMEAIPVPESNQTDLAFPEMVPNSATIILQSGELINYTFFKDPKCTLCEDKPAFHISWETSYVPTKVNVEFETGEIYYTFTDNLSTSMSFDFPFVDAVGSKVRIHAFVDTTGIRESGTIPWSSLKFSKQPSASLNGDLSAFSISWTTSYVPTRVELGYLSDSDFHSVAAYTKDLAKSMTVDLPFEEAVHGEMIVRAYYRTEDWKESSAFTLPLENYVSNVVSNSVNFEGKLGLNFYVRISDELLADPYAYAIISFNGVDTTVLISSAPVSEKDGITRRQFSQYVVAKKMRDEITLRLYDGEGNLTPLLDKEGNDVTAAGYTYSVLEYLNEIVEKSNNNYMVDLAIATRNYGTAAQIHFNYRADGLSIAQEVTDVTLSDLAEFAPVYSEQLPSGITKNTSTIVFEEDNTVRQYFTLEAGQDVSVYTFMQDGLQVTPLFFDTGKYYIALPNIAAKNLDVVHQYSVARGDEVYSFSFSPLSYVYKIIDQSTKESMKNLAKATYLYNQAANEYFAHKN